MKYLYVQKANNVSIPSGFLQDEAGNYSYIGMVVDGKQAPSWAPTDKIKAHPELFILISEQMYNKLMQQLNAKQIPIVADTKVSTENSNIQTTPKTYNSKMAFEDKTIVQAENASGQMSTARIEVPYGAGNEIITVNVGFDYTAPVAPGTNAAILIGDAFGLIKLMNPAYDNREAAVLNGLVITGTYGTSTVSMLQQFALKGMRFHIFQGTAATSTYWTNKVAARLVSCNVQGSAQYVNMDFQLWQDGTQYNDKIRQIPQFRFIISEFTAINLFINNGEQVSFTFQVRSTGAGNIMEIARA